MAPAARKITDDAPEQDRNGDIVAPTPRSGSKHSAPAYSDPAGAGGSFDNAGEFAAPPVRSGTPFHLSQDKEGLVLYELTNQKGGHVVFSPHCVKSVLDLKLLNVGYTSEKLCFTEVRTDLASKVGGNVTVPTIELSDGSNLTDSWEIACYLERKHPQGYKIFGSPTGKAFARFVDQFASKVLFPELLPVMIPAVHGFIDGPNQTYFRDVKVGAARFDAFLSRVQEAKSAGTYPEVFTAGPQAKMAIVEAALEQLEDGKVFLSESGVEPGHADFSLFGGYVYTRVCGAQVVKQVWEDSGPHVKRWTEAMLEWCGPDLVAEFPPL